MARRVGRVERSDISRGSDHATHAGVEAGKAARFGAAMERARDGAAADPHAPTDRQGTTLPEPAPRGRS